jgi:hypothetical protein
MQKNIGHKKIHRFSVEGSIYDEKDILRLKDQYQLGYVPQLDLDPIFSVQYDGKAFEFKLSIYGIYIGKAQAQCYQAAYGTKLMERPSYQKHKQPQS